MHKTEGVWGIAVPWKQGKVFVGFGQNMPGFKGAKRSHSQTAGCAISLDDSLWVAMGLMC